MKLLILFAVLLFCQIASANPFGGLECPGYYQKCKIYDLGGCEGFCSQCRGRTAVCVPGLLIIEGRCKCIRILGASQS